MNFLRKKSAFADREFADLSHMLHSNLENPTYKRELLDRKKLDFSIESLLHLDSYLEVLHAEPPADGDLLRVVMRCGAYAGEVIRKNSGRKMNWIAFAEAAKLSSFVKELGMSLGTAGILWENSQNMCFPLAKIGKFIEAGKEESTYAFARVILERPHS